MSAEAVAVLTARNDAANGQAEAAITALRDHRDAYPPAAELLIEVLELAGRTDEALEESTRAIDRFGDGTFAHVKLNIMARAGRQEEAEGYATSLLASPSALAPEQRIRLRQVLIQHRADARDFAAAERLCRDALAEFPGDADFAWALIAAQANQGEMSRAAASYLHLAPAAEQSCSRPAVAVLSHSIWSERTALTCIDQIQRDNFIADVSLNLVRRDQISGLSH